ncbi:hypothetical protein CB1_012719017 [Camelus ferus]|nr:hypothetical protein CB1_012719017 [Camelus ferus]
MPLSILDSSCQEKAPPSPSSSHRAEPERSPKYGCSLQEMNKPKVHDTPCPQHSKERDSEAPYPRHTSPYNSLTKNNQMPVLNQLPGKNAVFMTHYPNRIHSFSELCPEKGSYTLQDSMTVKDDCGGHGGSTNRKKQEKQKEEEKNYIENTVSGQRRGSEYHD